MDTIGPSAGSFDPWARPTPTPSRPEGAATRPAAITTATAALLDATFHAFMFRSPNTSNHRFPNTVTLKPPELSGVEAERMGLIYRGLKTRKA
jgi:hypothetical protein